MKIYWLTFVFLVLPYVKNHLHHTSSIINRSYYDCLYVHNQLYSKNNIELGLIDAWSLIPYCRRNLLPSKTDPNQCQGRQMTFNDLLRENVTIDDLFQWQVSIDILNDYAKFLRNGDSQIFCKCTTMNRFGKNCEYFLNNWPSTSLETLVDNYFRNGPEKMSETCYQGSLAKKCLNKNCLQWRQVCNGIYDCEMGEDESSCLILEENICQENEYRCRNGLCIPYSFSFDYVYDCLDRTDESYNSRSTKSSETVDHPICSKNPSIFCEEYSCYYLEESCDTFQCLSRTTGIHPFKSECYNREDELFWTTIFTYDYSIRQECWHTFMCLLDLEEIRYKPSINQRCSVICGWPRRIRRNFDEFSEEFTELLGCERGILSYCPTGLFLFPQQFLNIPFPANVSLKYNRSDPNFHRAGLPQYICYDGTWCEPDYSIPKRICRTLNQLNIPLTNKSSFWQFYEQLKRFFSLNCYPPALFTQFEIKSKNLYQCKNSNRTISIYRLKDETTDCSYADDELFDYRTICSFNLTDRMICSKGCIPKRDVLARKLGETCYSNQLSRIVKCSTSQDKYKFGCQWLRDGSTNQINKNHFDIFQHWKICDGYADDPNMTDEYNCQTWRQTCNRRNERCNGYWNCIDGSDEQDCEYNKNSRFLSPPDHHYCITPVGLTYLHIRQVGDGQIDCLGATDERDGFCFFKYPFEYSRRFRCMNSSICVRIENICDGEIHCPFEDDEMPCPWRKKLSNRKNCSNGMFACRDRLSCIISGKDRCFSYPREQSLCKYGEDFWFCDLIDSRRIYQPLSLDGFNHFPMYEKHSKINSQMNSNRTIVITTTTTSTTHRMISKTISTLNCHRGLPVGSNLCFCPPSYYGEYCQFQNDRISIHIAFQFHQYPDDRDDQSEFFRLVATLINQHNQTIDREELILNYLVSKFKHLFYLVYSNSTDENLSYSIVFDVYRISLHSVEFNFQEIHSIPFRFLPVNRLALIINLAENSQTKFTSMIPISKNICPLGRYGNDCEYHYNPCFQNNQCENGGTCYPFDIRSSKYSFICLCLSSYYGQRCEYRSVEVRIDISQSIQKQFTPSMDVNIIPMIVIYFADTDHGLPKLLIQNHFIYSNIQYNTSIIARYYRQSSLSHFIYAQIFYNAEQSDYFLIGLHKRSIEYGRTSILASHRCPHVNEIFLWNIYNLSEHSNYIDRIKIYYLSCYRIGLQCFYDEYSMCVCDNEGRFECFQFNHTVADCESTRWFCLNNGQCRQSSSKSTFACACPKCYYGELCQFTTSQYTISVDAFKINSTSIIIIFIIFILGTCANFLSMAVFFQPKLSTIGCSLYLRVLTIIGQIGLMGFFFKLIYLYYKWPNHFVLCIGLEFLLTLLPWTYDWLTACVAVERTINCAKGAHFDRQLSKRVAKGVIPFIISINILTNIYESFYRNLIVDPRSNGQSWCVIDYPKNYLWLIYLRKSLNIFHITFPFLINFISTFVLLSCTVTRKQLLKNLTETAKTKSFASIFLQEIRRIKHCLISPCLLFILGLPRLIFVFAFSCIEHSWQENIYMISYFISILPLTATLFIFILPSTDYLKELKKHKLIQIFKYFFNHSIGFN